MKLPLLRCGVKERDGVEWKRSVDDGRVTVVRVLLPKPEPPRRAPVFSRCTSVCGRKPPRCWGCTDWVRLALPIVRGLTALLLRLAALLSARPKLSPLLLRWGDSVVVLPP